MRPKERFEVDRWKVYRFTRCRVVVIVVVVVKVAERCVEVDYWWCKSLLNDGGTVWVDLAGKGLQTVTGRGGH
jgi:hypothetical protein